MLIAAGCTSNENTKKNENTPEENKQGDVLDKDFEQILESAKGSTVRFYGYGGDQKTNAWIDNYLTENVKKDYDITVKRVGMNIDEVLNIMLNEKQLNVEKGSIDVVWINGENFFTAKENDLLFGPLTEKLPNFNKYIDKESPDVQYDFGYPVNGYRSTLR